MPSHHKIGSTCFLLFYASSGEDETWDPDLDSDALSTLARKKDRDKQRKLAQARRTESKAARSALHRAPWFKDAVDAARPLEV